MAMSFEEYKKYRLDPLWRTDGRFLCEFTKAGFTVTLSFQDGEHVGTLSKLDNNTNETFICTCRSSSFHSLVNEMKYKEYLYRKKYRR